MKAKTKNKLKAIVAKSKKEQIKEVMLTYNWNSVRLITVKIEDGVSAGIIEKSNMCRVFSTHSLLKNIAISHTSSIKGKLAIFAVVKVINSDKTEELNKKEGNVYGKYFGTYVSDKQLTVFL